jgi:hypothetical protein
MRLRCFFLLAHNLLSYPAQLIATTRRLIISREIPDLFPTAACISSYRTQGFQYVEKENSLPLSRLLLNYYISGYCCYLGRQLQHIGWPLT